jgi:uncharacterized membrane protein
MSLLIAGLLLWSVHLIPSLAEGIKLRWVGRLGEKLYAASFAALVACGLALMIIGWRSTLPVTVYSPPYALLPVTALLMVLAFLLFAGSIHATRIKRIVRHPQLTSIVVWATAHLLAVGDTRDILLFGWLGIWAILEMILINRRDGEWIKPDPPSWAIEGRFVAISLAAFSIVAYLHLHIGA